MADIKFTAFIENVIRNQQGDVFALKTAEPHRRKAESGEWETTARTFRDVKVSRESGIQLAQFLDGERIDIIGTEKTERVRTVGGKDIYPLVVWATTITRSGNAPVPSAAEPANTWNDTPPEDPWATEPGWAVTPIPTDETPF